MENMLEVMGRLKNVKNLDSRRCAQVRGGKGEEGVHFLDFQAHFLLCTTPHTSDRSHPPFPQVDWAYASVKQHGRQVPRKQRAPMQEYIRHLLLVRLSKSSVGEVAKKLLKVPWEENERYILKCLLKVRGRKCGVGVESGFRV